MHSIKKRLSSRLLIFWLIFMSLFVVLSYVIYRNSVIELLHSMPTRVAQEYTKTNAGNSWTMYRINPERVYFELFWKKYSFIFLLLFLISVVLMVLHLRFFSREIGVMFHTMSKIVDKQPLEQSLPIELQAFQQQIETYKTRADILQTQNEQFRSFASHELRNELAIMRGLLDEYGVIEPELLKQQQYIETTVQDLLILSYDVTAAEFEAVDPVLLTAKVLDSFQSDALLFTFDEESTWHPVFAKENWLYRAIYNLVDNALRYRVTGTHVEVEVFERETGIQIVITNQTTKQDFPKIPTGHGIGLKLVTHVMETIDGVYYYEICDGKVTSILSIPTNTIGY